MNKHWYLARLTALALLGGLSAPIYAEPATDLQPRIEAGAHTAAIRRVAIDRAGRFLVTASEDKTARIWEADTGRLLTVLRPPIGEGERGKLRAIAITGDGDVIALAGATDQDAPDSGYAIYLFDRASGAMIDRLEGLPDVVTRLAFSESGHTLAACTGGKGGLHLFDWRAAKRISLDTDYGGDCYGASWHGDDQLTTTSYDGQLRQYRVGASSLELRSRKSSPGGLQPFAVAYSPDGRELAVGYNDVARVDILSAETLALLFVPILAQVNAGQLASVAWSADGQRLYGAGRADRDSRVFVRIWSDRGRGNARDVINFTDSVLDLAPRQQGGMMVATAEPVWGLIDTDDRWRPRSLAPTADLRDQGIGIKVSADGNEVQFGFAYLSTLKYKMSVKQRKLTSSTNDTLGPPRVDGLDIKGWQNSLSPLLAGKPLKLDRFEEARALAVAPDASSFILASEWTLRRFDRTGRALWSRLVPSTPWSVNIPSSGRVFVAAYADGTVRWHRIVDGQELLAFFPHADRQRWVIWTPSGYYDASAGGEELIGWHANRDNNQAAQFLLPIELRDRYRRPDVIDLMLQTLDENEAVLRADAALSNKVSVPLLELTSGASLTVTDSHLSIAYKTRSPVDAPVVAIAVRVNDFTVTINTTTQATADAVAAQINVVIPTGDSEIQLAAINRNGTSLPVTVKVKWAGPTVANR